MKFKNWLNIKDYFLIFDSRFNKTHSLQNLLEIFFILLLFSPIYDLLRTDLSCHRHMQDQLSL